MPARTFLVLSLNALVALPAVLGQTTTPPAQAERPLIHTTTREVLVDMVVRDKHHHAVADLRPEEVEIYEDGVRQKIRVFRSIKGGEQLETERNTAGAQKEDESAAKGSNARPLNTLRQVNFVSVVFAEIAPLNLEFARRAVQEFLKSDNLPNTYVTIYRLDRTLQLLQPYTSDKDVLAKSVEVATKGLRGGGALDVNSTVASTAIAALNASAENILASSQAGSATVQAVQTSLMNPLNAIAQDPLFAANAASQDVSIQLGNALLAQA